MLLTTIKPLNRLFLPLSYKSTQEHLNKTEKRLRTQDKTHGPLIITELAIF